MEFGPDKVLIVEADAILREHVANILTDAGYQVSAEFAVTLKTVLKAMPDVIVLGANPPQLDCCDLLADVKRSEQARHVRVIMLATGGSAERTRGLDLGADDVLTVPFEDRELLARVRAQLSRKASRGRAAPERPQWQEVAARSSPRYSCPERRETHATLRPLAALSLCAARHCRDRFPLLAFAKTKCSSLYGTGEITDWHRRRTRTAGDSPPGKGAG